MQNGNAFAISYRFLIRTLFLVVKAFFILSTFIHGGIKMQQLSVNLTIPIPEDSVLISKIELQELKQEQLTGVYWSMKDLEERINRKNEWIRENILYPTEFKKVLDVEYGGFVFYPKTKGQSWSFHAKKMAKFLDTNFHRIFT